MPIPCSRALQIFRNWALPFLLYQTTVNRWDGAFMVGVTELLERLLRQVPVFRLRCRLDAGAVRCLRSVLEAEDFVKTPCSGLAPEAHL